MPGLPRDVGIALANRLAARGRPDPKAVGESRWRLCRIRIRWWRGRWPKTGSIQAFSGSGGHHRVSHRGSTNPQPGALSSSSQRLESSGRRASLEQLQPPGMLHILSKKCRAGPRSPASRSRASTRHQSTAIRELPPDKVFANNTLELASVGSSHLFTFRPTVGMLYAMEILHDVGLLLRYCSKANPVVHEDLEPYKLGGCARAEPAAEWCAMITFPRASHCSPLSDSPVVPRRPFAHSRV